MPDERHPLAQLLVAADHAVEPPEQVVPPGVGGRQRQAVLDVRLRPVQLRLPLWPGERVDGALQALVGELASLAGGRTEPGSPEQPFGLAFAESAVENGDAHVLIIDDRTAGSSALDAAAPRPSDTAGPRTATLRAMATKSTAEKAPARTPGPTSVARAYFKAIAEKDLDAAAALWVPGSTDRLVGFAEFSVPAGFKQWFGALFAAFPDFTFEVLQVTVLEGERRRAVARDRDLQRHGQLRGDEAERRLRSTITGCDMLTVREGKIVDNHGYMNGTELARQLGAAPPAGSPAEKAMIGALNARVSAKEAIERFRNR